MCLSNLLLHVSVLFTLVRLSIPPIKTFVEIEGNAFRPCSTEIITKKILHLVLAIILHTYLLIQCASYSQGAAHGAQTFDGR